MMPPRKTTAPRMKISKLELTLSRAKIIEAKDLPNDKIYILSRVTVKDVKTGETCEYLLVSPEESNFEANKISGNLTHRKIPPGQDERGDRGDQVPAGS